MTITKKQLKPPVRRAGPQKELDEKELARLATPYFERLLAMHPVNMRRLFSKSIFDLANRSAFAVTSRQALIYVLGCNGFTHTATAACLGMNASTCVYIFRRATDRYENDLQFRGLCDEIAFENDLAHGAAGGGKQPQTH